MRLKGVPEFKVSVRRLLEIKNSKIRWLKMYVLCYKFYTQVFQVYLQPFRHNSLLKLKYAP